MESQFTWNDQSEPTENINRDGQAMALRNSDDTIVAGDRVLLGINPRQEAKVFARVSIATVDQVSFVPAPGKKSVVEGFQCAKKSRKAL